MGDPAEAIFPLHRSIQAGPSNPQSWALLAQNYARVCTVVPNAETCYANSCQ